MTIHMPKLLEHNKPKKNQKAQTPKASTLNHKTPIKPSQLGLSMRIVLNNLHKYIAPN